MKIPSQVIFVLKQALRHVLLFNDFPIAVLQLQHVFYFLFFWYRTHFKSKLCFSFLIEICCFSFSAFLISFYTKRISYLYSNCDIFGQRKNNIKYLIKITFLLKEKQHIFRKSQLRQKGANYIIFLSIIIRCVLIYSDCQRIRAIWDF